MNKGEIILGAWDEDQYDPVFPQNNLMIAGQQTSVLSTLSHFWDPDKDLNTFYFNFPNINLWDINGIIGKVIFSSHPTAYSKVLYYINGKWPPISYVMTKENDIWSGYNTCGYDYENGLINLYYTGELRKKYHWYHSKIFNIDTYTLDDNLVYWNNEKSKGLVYNILGRIAHLIADMSVPAHTHTTLHAFNANDYYEDWVKDNNLIYWTAEKVFRERGDYIDPYSYSNNGFNSFIEYYMYSMAQISQHYASRAVNGNDTYDQLVGEIKSILDTYGDKGPITTNGNTYNHNQEDMEGIRDATLPYLIRLTAGLFYWFISETGQLETGGICHKPVELNLSDHTLSGDHYTFAVSINNRSNINEGIITVCPSSSESFTITNSARNITFNAEREIVFKHGFTAELGSNVHVYISSSCETCKNEDKNPRYGKR